MRVDNKLDLDNPKDAKFFLRGVRINGREITHVNLVNGKTLAVEDMSDEQLVTYAKDVYLDFCGGAEGEDGFIHLETAGMDQ